MGGKWQRINCKTDDLRVDTWVAKIELKLYSLPAELAQNRPHRVIFSHPGFMAVSYISAKIDIFRTKLVNFCVLFL